MINKQAIVVRAYDLGGFGDIAGALRVTDYLSKLGNNVGIRPMSNSAKQKIDLLAPNYPHITNQDEAELIVDVAGHYNDSRLKNELVIPY